MPSKNGRRPLVRPGEPTQRTKTGLEIPIPSREELDEALRKVARKGRGKREKPSKSG
jgi:hypothetical protein